MYSSTLRWVLLALLTAVLAASAFSSPAPAPSAFGEFGIFGLSMSTKDFVSGQVSYSLTLNSGAFLVSGGYQYPIEGVWGFFAVNRSENDSNNFAASGPAYGGWVWDQHPVNGTDLSVGGWVNKPKNEMFLTPASGSASKAFDFTGFSFSGTAPILGVHVSLVIPSGYPSPFVGGGATGNVIPQPVPEPGSLAALGLGLVSLLGAKRRRT